MKHLLLSVILSVLLVVACARKDNTVAENNGIKTIEINVDGCEKDMDISDMFDTSFFRIVPLETKPECLLGSEIKHIFYRNDRMYVVEDMAKGVFVFDDTGKFVTKIQSYGQGPEEYIEITGVSITGDRIFIFDQFSRKVLIYDLDCNYISQFSVSRNLPAHEIFAIDDRVYYVSKWELVRKDYGPYRLASTNTKGGDLQKHIPFDTAIVWPGSIDYNNAYTNTFSDVKLMYKRTDTIYSASSKGIRPEYIIDMGDKALPESFRTNIREASTPDNKKKYINGIRQMLETKDKLIFSFEYGNLPPYDAKEHNRKHAEDPVKYMAWLRSEWPTTLYHAFYDKNTGETTVTNGLSMSYFDKYRIDFRYYDYPYVVFRQDIYPSDVGKTAVDAIKIPQNPRYEKKYKEVVAGIKEGDNPIVFVYKLKR